MGTANVTYQAHGRVRRGRLRRRLEREEPRVRLTVECDRSRRPGADKTAEQVASQHASDQEYRRLKNVVNVERLDITKRR